MIKHIILVCLGFISTSMAAANKTDVDFEELNRVIAKAQNNSWAEMKDNGWNFPTYLGSWFLSEYYFELKALGLLEQSQFNETFFTQLLLDTQLPDGSWEQVHEHNLKTGGLDPTIFNYLYLKTVGVDHNSEMMVKAKNWVLAHGGVEGAQTMSKMKLAAFGHYSWTGFLDIPLMIFRKEGLFSYAYVKDVVAQWVYPHLTALTYMRHFQVVYELGEEITELWLRPPREIRIHEVNIFGSPSWDVENLVNEIMLLRQKKGSFGGYTISTLLSMLALKHFNSHWPDMRGKEIQSAIQQGFKFVEFNYFNDRVPYQGSLDDGRWWDTILVSWGLLEAGTEPEKLVPMIDNMLAEGMQSNGGIAYGYDFEYAPDADDTGLLVLVLSKFGDRYKDQIKKSNEWLATMQNPDGGFPAFDTNKMENQLIFKFAMDLVGISNSAEIFDPSSPDVTTHIMEGYAANGVSLSHPVIQRSIEYLKNTQASYGSWQARWGINFVYSMGCVIPGLKRIGYNLKEEWVAKSIKWLTERQNRNGGFGETTLSYNNPDLYNGVGVSTVSQTAWALLALIDAMDVYDVQEEVDRAVSFLLSEFKRLGDRFFDISVVGTGHRGVLYLQYPSYAFSFPLIALSRYRARFANSYSNTTLVEPEAIKGFLQL